MISMIACRTCQEMREAGWQALDLPHGDKTPIPGLLAFANEQHDLVIVLSDGKKVFINQLIQDHRNDLPEICLNPISS